MWTTALSRSNRTADRTAASSSWLSTVTYRSRATAPVSDRQLQELVEAAQARNRSESITGLIIYDGEQFLQWLEGPVEALSRVMHSISHDVRHTDIQILGQAKTPVRMFENWHLKLKRKPLPVEAAADKGAWAWPETASEPRPPVSTSSASLAAEAIALPALPKKTDVISVSPADEIDSPGSELARLLISSDPTDASRLIDEMIGRVDASADLAASLFEPAARCLGDLWSEDRCTEFEVTIGLCHLQSALRRVNYRNVPAPPHCYNSHKVLIVPQPGEIHLLCAAFSSETLWQAGWRTHCDFPATDEALQELLANEWFDALDLSLSAAFRREHWLSRIEKTISGARAASRNPALAVVMGGRLFAERQELGALVGADGCINAAVDVVDVILSSMRRRARSPRRG